MCITSFAILMMKFTVLFSLVMVSALAFIASSQTIDEEYEGLTERNERPIANRKRTCLTWVRRKDCKDNGKPLRRQVRMRKNKQ